MTCGSLSRLSGKGPKVGNVEPDHQFVGERGRILSRIGDEDLELVATAGVGHSPAPDLKVVHRE
jgi:hypothetical protein